MAVSQQKQPHEPQINGGSSGPPPVSSTRTTGENNMGENSMGSKRQRRPSVRLVEIGDQPASALSKQWKTFNRVSRTRPLTNLGGLEEGNAEQTGEDRERGDFNFDNLAIGSWKIKGFNSKREHKRPRTNWVSKKIDNSNVGEAEFSKDFEFEGSESPLKEQNPVHDSSDNGRDLHFRAPHSTRAGIGDDGIYLDGTSDDREQIVRGWGKEDDAVRLWLDGLGLRRYWPVFEIHEVDEEVLPLLTLEDLKDMGINAVGSRRKMYCAIQKLNEGFS